MQQLPPGKLAKHESLLTFFLKHHMSHGSEYGAGHSLRHCRSTLDLAEFVGPLALAIYWQPRSHSMSIAHHKLAESGQKRGTSISIARDLTLSLNHARARTRSRTLVCAGCPDSSAATQAYISEGSLIIWPREAGRVQLKCALRVAMGRADLELGPVSVDTHVDFNRFPCDHRGLGCQLGHATLHS